MIIASVCLCIQTLRCMVVSPLFVRFASLLGAAVSVFSWTALALNPGNAGPESVELKFKIPAPKPLSPEEELATFKVAPGFRVELVAAEPMVDSPVAVTWDEKGRMFVCEMRGYMHDVEGGGEDVPNGRVVMLEDTDGDGKMDKRSVFADGLLMPRAVACVNGGVLVAEPPNLWFMKDTDGDGVADTRELVDTTYGTAGGQPEHMANSPTWAMDNWIYSANHPKRYRFKDGKFIEEVAGQRGQWGLTQDNYGRLYFNSNSDFLRTNALPESLAKRNPNYPTPSGLGVQVMKDQVTWPSHPTPGVNRGYDEKTLRADGSLTASTATCGPAIYRGHLFPKEYQGNAFIPEPAGNLVKRLILSEKNGIVSGTNAVSGTEFWTSTDERFRPVNAFSGPDGALYVVDQYRGVIQHKSFLTHYLVANIKDRNLESPFEQGRIWRVVPTKGKLERASLPTESGKLVAMLGHPNGWVRDTAQRLLVERKDSSVTPALEALARDGKTALAKIHALWTLDGMGSVVPEVISACLKQSDYRVRSTAVRLAGRAQLPELVGLLGDSSPEVQVELAFQFSAFPEMQDAALTLAAKAGSQDLVRDALMSGLRGRELEVLQSLLESKGKGDVLKLGISPAFTSALAQAVMTERKKDRVGGLLRLIAAQPSKTPPQLALLSGAAGKSPNRKGAPAVKLLYLDAAPPELADLAAKLEGAGKEDLKNLDARLAWPGKPGVPPPPVIKPLTGEEMALFDKGKGIYTALCAGCHQPSGLGMQGLAPGLVDSEWVLAASDIPIRILMNGLAGPIKVGPVSWNLEMPPLGAALSDEQIAAVLTYVRREWEHNGSPVSLAAVAKLRGELGGRTKSWSESELKALMQPKGLDKKVKPVESGPKEKPKPTVLN